MNQILIGLLLISCFFSCNQHSSTTEKKGAVMADSTEVSKDTIHRIKLSFVGDIMGHTNQIKAALGDPEQWNKAGVEAFNYETCFRYVQPIFEEADLMIGNLELTLSNKGRYKGYPMFRTPDIFAAYLKDAGFDFLTTCNNHSNDGFLYGVNHTIDVLDSLELMHTGTFKNQAERDSLYPFLIEKEVDGTTFRLVFLNYTYGTNGLDTRAPAIVNLIDKYQIFQDLEAAKKLAPDMIIAMMHWGKEYRLDEHKKQVELTNLLWENGVDVVIGAHPHVIEPIKMDTIWNADSTVSKDVLVAYSLGNFISNQYRPNTDMGLIFELELEKNSKTNQTRIGKHDYILTWRYIQGRYNTQLEEGFDWSYAVLPVTAFEENPKEYFDMTDQQVKAMNNVTRRMRAHLGKWGSVERKITLGELQPIQSMKVVKDTTDVITQK